MDSPVKNNRTFPWRELPKNQKKEKMLSFCNMRYEQKLKSSYYHHEGCQVLYACQIWVRYSGPARPSLPEAVDPLQLLLQHLLGRGDELQRSDELRRGEQQLHGGLRLVYRRHQLQLIV